MFQADADGFTYLEVSLEGISDKLRLAVQLLLCADGTVKSEVITEGTRADGTDVTDSCPGIELADLDQAFREAVSPHGHFQ